MAQGAIAFVWLGLSDTDWLKIGAVLFGILCLSFLSTISTNLARIDSAIQQIRHRIAPTDFEVRAEIDHRDKTDDDL